MNSGHECMAILLAAQMRNSRICLRLRRFLSGYLYEIYERPVCRVKWGGGQGEIDPYSNNIMNNQYIRVWYCDIKSNGNIEKYNICIEYKTCKYNASVTVFYTIEILYVFRRRIVFFFFFTSVRDNFYILFSIFHQMYLSVAFY